ncbi:hypothetical protein K0M31_017239 [Melipona bicolor]|uniref:Uncharacterized protein n=1 Tax=Melipona bicolor TaxID=60889 RepID=A0AA40KS92_9HYME|nr:hypothetical protein K0M31_017239 [Melipona bicolor]
MPRSRPETFELMVEAERPSKCIKFLRFLWKFFRCVFSHVSLVSLVVLYCLIGAYAFEALEATHEKEIKKSIKDIRGNVAEQLWKITKEVEVLIRENWTDKALRELKVPIRVLPQRDTTRPPEIELEFPPLHHRC